MSELRIGYARVSTDEEDVAAQRDELVALGVPAERGCMCRPRADRYRPRPARAAPSVSRLPDRRHAGSHQARPPGAVGSHIADDSPVNREQLQRREYHHLFPNSLLVKERRVPESESFRALNCALVTWRTNRNISAKEPLSYLRYRIDRSDLGEEEIRRRLESHLIPFDAINVGGYADIADADERADRIAADYERFIHARAEMVHAAALKLCSGRSWSTPV